jgi:hypothetical protein
MSTLEQYFSQPKFTRPRRLIVAVVGPVKSGKTTLGLTATELGPLAMLDYDYGTEGPISNFAGRKIWHLPLDVPTSMLLEKDVTLEDYKRTWIKAKEAYYAALADPTIKTIMVDTATEWWEACRLSFFGKLDKVWPQNRYAEPNGEYRKLIRDALEHPDKNIILNHHVKDEWVGDNRTGNKVFAGFSGTMALVQMVVALTKDDLTIVDCRHKRALEGAKLPSSIASFPQLINLVHGPEVE